MFAAKFSRSKGDFLPTCDDQWVSRPGGTPRFALLSGGGIFRSVETIEGPGDELFTFSSAQNGNPEGASFDGGAGNDTLDATFGTIGFATGGLTTSFTNNGDGTFSATYARGDGDGADSVSISNIENVFISVFGDSNGVGNEDFVRTGDGNDSVFTDNGADTIVAGKGVDTVDGGTSDEFGERDVISKDFSDVATAIVWNIQTGAFSGPGSFTNLEAFGSLQTGSGNDTIVSDLFSGTGTTGTGDSSFSTGAGADTVTLFHGNDTVDMGTGNDTLIMDYETHNIFLGNNGGTLTITETSPGVYSGTMIAHNSNVSVTFSGVENFVFLGHVSGGNEFDGADTITTGAGDDLIRTNEGSDWINAGTGNDTVDGGEQGPDFDGLAKEFGGGAPAITFDLQANVFSGPGSYTNFEWFIDLRTGSGSDTIITTAMQDSSSGRGDEMITTRGGRDTITVSNGNDTVDGGGGTDRLIMDYATTNVWLGNGTSSTLTITETSPGTYSGTLTTANSSVSVDFSGIESFVFRGHVSGGNEFGGRDDITTGDGNDILEGFKGGDLFFAGGGRDLLDGGEGNDSLHGEDGNDKLYGGTGHDSLLGGFGKDRMYGDDGNDRLFGEQGNDRMFGGVGTDLLDGGIDNDKLLGQDGNDTLLGDKGDDKLFGGRDNDLLDGGNNNDTLSGAGGDDTLLGGGGDDVLHGANGRDVIDGGAGADAIFAGKGADTITGGIGADIFRFQDNTQFDTITDFEIGFDQIHLRSYREENGGRMTFDQLLITQNGADTRIELDLNRDGIADVIDLDGDGSGDPWRLDLLNTDATALTAVDFVF